ncbi:hypothetical protein RFI_33061, partial [Reticulomyxa filosa]
MISHASFFDICKVLEKCNKELNTCHNEKLENAPLRMFYHKYLEKELVDDLRQTITQNVDDIFQDTHYSVRKMDMIYNDFFTSIKSICGIIDSMDKIVSNKRENGYDLILSSLNQDKKKKKNEQKTFNNFIVPFCCCRYFADYFTCWDSQKPPTHNRSIGIVYGCFTNNTKKSCHPNFWNRYVVHQEREGHVPPPMVLEPPSKHQDISLFSKSI